MNYTSTRGGASVSSSYAVLKGIAPDGGLYVPEKFPRIFENLSGLADLSYEELAFEVLRVYLTDFSEAELKECIAAAYGENFDEFGVAPLVNVGDAYFLELFHGRTSAFKDVALSILPHLTTLAARKNAVAEKPVVLTATSGDTGKAALAGFASVPGIYIIVFFPKDGVSYIQKKQMQTQAGDNVLVVGIDGNFDQAQAGVKAIFNDVEFSERLKNLGYALTSANSINIGRLLPQIVYYFHAYGQMLKNNEISMGDELDFTVPTGNFGNILAGYYAKRMGLPVGKLICASNDNKILSDFFETGEYDVNREFYQTTSPSMDILVSSNLERFLYHLCGDAEKIRSLMEGLSKKGRFEFKLPGDEIIGGFATEAEARGAIKKLYEKGYVMDTHTAVGFAVYEKRRRTGVKNVILSTASPYKFSEDVLGAIEPESTGMNVFQTIRRLQELSQTTIPANIKALEDKPILHDRTCKDMFAEVLSFLQ